MTRACDSRQRTDLSTSCGVSPSEATGHYRRLVARDDEEDVMRKLMVAAAVAAVSTLGFVGRADAQAFYPKTPKAPARVQGAYSYPGQYPSYPGQYPEYPTTSRARRDAGRHVKRDRDGDDDDRSRYGAQNRYDPRSSYGYGSCTPAVK